MHNAWLRLAAALAVGFGLRFVVDLDPLWPLAWVMPGLLFFLALRSGGWMAAGLVALAGLVGAAANLPFYLRVMPPVPAAIVTVLTALGWVAICSAARYLATRLQTAWAVLALPAVAVTLDTLLAHFTPDGNWGSVGYTQAELLPIAQLASLSGIGGILFLVMLVNSCLAFALHRGLRDRGVVIACATAAVLVGAAAVFGAWRLRAPLPAGAPVSFGIAAVDDFIADPHGEKARDVWTQYEAQVQELAASGAHVVLLPEKIDVLPAADAELRKRRLSILARANRVWLVAGVGVDTGGQRRNEAWVFAPGGELVTNYLKHFMAPPEREFVPGSEFPVREIDGARYGVAICKDMHFASLGREFGRREAAVMLVPAWDFDADAELAANMTKLRGIENGFTIVRSSRNGLLSITDALGRVLATDRSAKLPGTTLFATVTVGPRVPTLYTRVGDVLGWACIAITALLTALAFGRGTPHAP